MAQEDKLLDHNFDGIQEYDNPLPRWWLWLFYITIIFSVIYLPYYHMFGGKLPLDEYAEEVEIAEKFKAEREAERKKALPAPAAPSTETAKTESTPAVASSGQGASDEGKAIYMVNCVACHGTQGEGGIGPNLTDEYWLHGNTEADLLKVVTEGVLDKGMIAWKTVLNPTKIQNVVSYIQTLQGTNPPNAKAPQGEKY